MTTEKTDTTSKDPKSGKTITPVNDASEDRRLLRIVAEIARKEAVKNRKSTIVSSAVRVPPRVDVDSSETESTGSPAVAAFLEVRSNFNLVYREKYSVQGVLREIRHVFTGLRAAEGTPGAAGKSGISPSEIKRDGSVLNWYVALSESGVPGADGETAEDATPE